jgi:hypothetical protein
MQARAAIGRATGAKRASPDRRERRDEANSRSRAVADGITPAGVECAGEPAIGAGTARARAARALQQGPNE